MSEKEKFEIEIRESLELVQRMDRKIDLVQRLLAEHTTLIRPDRGNFVNCIGMEMVWCPPGTFWMGSPEDEEGRKDDETLHEVTFSLGFWIGKYPVTQRHWNIVTGENPSSSKESGPDAPVEKVSWDDAEEFCRVLSHVDGRAYALPTESQWEYACRGGSSSAYYFGHDATQLGEHAWYSENSDPETYPVGQKISNAWGIYDMYGNVWECCQDWYGDYPSGAVTDPTGPDVGTVRVYRGGSFVANAHHCRSANRHSFPQDFPFKFHLGFRPVVRSAL